MTAIVVENELGNDDKVKSYIEEMEKYEVDLTDRLQEYLDGKITAKQLFTEGTGDVE